MWQNHIGNGTTRGKKRKSKNLVKMLWKIQPNGIIRKEHLAEFPDVSMKTNALLWREKNSSWRKKEWEKVLGCEYFRFRQWQHLSPPQTFLSLWWQFARSCHAVLKQVGSVCHDRFGVITPSMTTTWKKAGMETHLNIKVTLILRRVENIFGTFLIRPISFHSIRFVQQFCNIHEYIVCIYNFRLFLGIDSKKCETIIIIKSLSFYNLHLNFSLGFLFATNGLGNFLDLIM